MFVPATISIFADLLQTRGLSTRRIPGMILQQLPRRFMSYRLHQKFIGALHHDGHRLQEIWSSILLVDHQARLRLSRSNGVGAGLPLIHLEVALALARARIMGARYPYYLLADSPAGQQKEAEINRTAPSQTLYTRQCSPRFPFMSVFLISPSRPLRIIPSLM